MTERPVKRHDDGSAGDADYGTIGNRYAAFPRLVALAHWLASWRLRRRWWVRADLDVLLATDTYTRRYWPARNSQRATT